MHSRSQSVSRRAFLTSCAAATQLLATQSLWAAESEKKLNLKKAVKFAMIQEKLSIMDKFKLLKDLGFAGTEIHVRQKVDRNEVKVASEKTGVQVHGFLNSSLPDLKYAIDSAKFYGATSVLVVAGRVNKANSYEQVYKQQQTRLRDALPYAEKQNIKLLVENVWNNFLLSPLEMARFIDELNSSALGVYFDVGNVVRMGWPEHWIRILGKRIVKLDIKEYSRKLQLEQGLRKGFNVEIGEGDCDWPAVRKSLIAIGYTSGWATAEVKGGDRKRLAEISMRMDKALNLN